MDARELKAFLHLAETLHFGEAAQRGNLSPSALSRTIQRLEAELGCRLFDRNNREVRLTPPSPSVSPPKRHPSKRPAGSTKAE